MLTQLSIQNIALIERLTVSFAPGLNVLTGETGAGKSIVVGALDFVLGGRADKDRIAGGAEKGQVEALFDVSQEPRVAALLAELNVEIEDGLLPLMREINQTGRSVSRVAGVVVPLSQLKRVTSLLVDLHGQHAHQSLLDPGTHLHFLDVMGDAEHQALVRQVRETFAQWSAAKRALADAEGNVLERARREDMLRFQLEELDGANLVEDEEEDLVQQRDVMRNAENIRDGLERTYAILTGGIDDELPSAMDALRMALDALSAVSRYSDAYEKVYDQLAESVYAVEGVASDVDALRDVAESDPERLDEIEARLDLLGKLKRKYGETISEMIAFRERAREELDQVENIDTRIDNLQKEEKRTYAALQDEAKRLSDTRHALAQVCETRVLEQLRDLGMQAARFAVSFAEDAPFSADGLDKVEFLLSANAGEPMRPLSRVASGGELSRIMLAFKVIEAENEGIPVLVFDEVDTGISGRMGQIVAEKMKQVAGSRQVLCVTHLPQIAAIADEQYLVDKHEEGGRTRTTVTLLDTEGRVDAIARMLGGGETAIPHARAMLEQ